MFVRICLSLFLIESINLSSHWHFQVLLSFISQPVHLNCKWMLSCHGNVDTCKLYLWMDGWLLKRLWPFNFLVPLAERPASYCHGFVSVMRPSIQLSICLSVRVSVGASVNSSSSDAVDWIFTKFHRNFLRWVLLQIPSNNCVLWRILVAMAIKVKNL